MRRILVDTNVLLAALVFPVGIAAQAFSQVINEERLSLTQVILDEVRDVVERKWPNRITSLDRFLADLDYELLPVAPLSTVIRDQHDQPILDSAIASNVDVILTGDKDFLALGIDRPTILGPREYLDTDPGA